MRALYGSHGPKGMIGRAARGYWADRGRIIPGAWPCMVVGGQPMMMQDDT